MIGAGCWKQSCVTLYHFVEKVEVVSYCFFFHVWSNMEKTKKEYVYGLIYVLCTSKTWPVWISWLLTAYTIVKYILLLHREMEAWIGSLK